MGVLVDHVEDLYDFSDREFCARERHFFAFVADYQFYVVLGEQQLVLGDGVRDPAGGEDDTFAEFGFYFVGAVTGGCWYWHDLEGAALDDGDDKSTMCAYELRNFWGFRTVVRKKK